jgi:lysophospholipase L1-like esterase
VDYDSLIDGIQQRAPDARIVVLNLPNMGALPFLAGGTLPERQAAQRASVGMSKTGINVLTGDGVRVVDLMCDARFYLASTFSADGFHPNDQGYAMFADHVVKAASATSYPSPQTTCPQMTLIP